MANLLSFAMGNHVSSLKGSPFVSPSQRPLVLPLGDLVLASLEERFTARPELDDVTGIIVLGGAEQSALSRAHGMPLTSEAGERFLAAIALARRFPEASVAFTGDSASIASPDGVSRNVAAALLLEAGITPERIVIEDRSRNTAQNAALLREVVGPAGEGTWVLVTSAYHMPRAVGAFCQAGWPGLVAWPTDYRSGAFWDRAGWDLAGHLDDLNTGVKEWIGLVAYRVTGRTSSLFPAGCTGG